MQSMDLCSDRQSHVERRGRGRGRGRGRDGRTDRALGEDRRVAEFDVLAQEVPGQNNLVSIPHHHPLFSPLHFVLLYPHGELDWHPNLKLIVGNNKEIMITLRDYAAYFMHDRDTQQWQNYSLFTRGARLFQEWIISNWARIDSAKLKYLRANQEHLRATTYKVVKDTAVAQQAGGGNATGATIGKPSVILPSSHVGSPRYMAMLFQDAMAVVRYHGKPDLFVTFTCNPNWPEIQNELRPGETAQDRADLVARVFKLKKEALLSDLEGGKIFGCPVAIVHVVEWQKRGLPHVHILLILKSNAKIHPEMVDGYICAELPNPENEPRLYRIVTQHLLHGPCGLINPKQACMQNGDCSKKYPKEWQDETDTSGDGYPKYRRRDDGNTYKK